MIWVLPVKRMTPQIKQRMREELQSEAMMFNGRLVIPCACVAGGSKGGVTRDNIDDVMMEAERYLDGTEYNLHGPGAGVRVNRDEWVAFRKSSDAKPIYQITDWHNSRTTSGFLERQRERKHFMGGWIPRCTWVMQPADVEGFGDGKQEVADLKVPDYCFDDVCACTHTQLCLHSLSPQAGLEDIDRYVIAKLWIRSLKKIWNYDFVMKSLRKSGVKPFTRLRHLEGNRAIVSVADCILRAEEMGRQEEAYKSREVEFT